MKLTITNKTDAEKTIDRFGDNLQTIKRLQDENKALKALYERWAFEHPDEAFDGPTMEGRTARFAYALAEGVSALKVQTHLDREDVVQKLEDDEEMCEYVVKTFDAEAIKADFGTSKEKRRSVEDFGLYFTTPKPHLAVEAL